MTGRSLSDGRPIIGHRNMATPKHYPCIWLALLCLQAAAQAAVYQATPSTYTTLMAGLKAGDTLNLAAGTYPRLSPTGLQGTATAWITIAGPASGSPAIIMGAACCNTVEIRNS